MVVGSKVPGQTIKTRPLMTSPPMKTVWRAASIAKATEWSVTQHKQSWDLPMIAQYTFPLTKHQNGLSWKYSESLRNDTCAISARRAHKFIRMNELHKVDHQVKQHFNVSECKKPPKKCLVPGVIRVRRHRLHLEDKNILQEREKILV